MSRLFLFISVLLVLSLSCWAEDEGARHEITVQGSGFIGKTTTGAGIQAESTNSGGVVAGYRFNINNWIAAEANYDFFSNSQKYASSAGVFRAQTYMHGFTGAAVVKLPAFYKVKTFVLAGGGGLSVHPRNAHGLESQMRGAFVYGGGGDVPVMKHVALRAEYRGLVYKVPDFGLSRLKADKYTYGAVPSAGLVFTF